MYNINLGSTTNLTKLLLRQIFFQKRKNRKDFLNCNTVFKS